MTLLEAVLCLLIGCAIPLVALTAMLRRGWRQLAVATAYGDVARQLGLDVDTRGVSLQGHLGDQRLWVGEVLVGHGPDRRMVCWGVLDHERPLGLGLVLKRRGRFRRRARTLLAVDDLEGWDRRLEIGGDDPALVRALLDPPVRRALAALASRWHNLVVTDTSVLVYLRQPPSRANDLRELVDAMQLLSAALSAARRAIEPPVPLRAALPAWQRAAERLGLEVEPAYPGIAGILDGRTIRVTPVRTDDGYAHELRVGFRDHNRTGLRVRRQTEPDGYWSVGQDIQTGDPPFDRAFVLKGWDPEAILELLSPPVREGLLALDAVSEIDVDDLRLYAGRVGATPEEIEPVVVQAVRVAEAMGW